MRTSNPALNTSSIPVAYGTGEVMTAQGAVNKTGLLLVLAFATAVWTWNQFFQSGGSPEAVGGLVMIGAIGGFITALVIIFKKAWAPFLAPVYALLEGLVLGGVSAITEASYPGLPTQAVLLTFGTLFALLAAYKAGLITVTDKFRMGVVAATGGIMVVYLISFVLGFFGMSVPLIHEAGLVGIGFSLVVVIIASLNLVLDFDFIATASRMGAPKYMEWYAAFGLLITLVWLYLEMLRLLTKIQNRR